MKKSRARIIIEFTTEFSKYEQGRYEMKGDHLVIGKGGGGTRDNYLDLAPYLEFRPQTADFIASRHFTIVYDSETRKLRVMNHSKNGVLVDYYLVNEEPRALLNKQHQIRLGQILLNEKAPRFTLYTINLRVQVL